MKTMMLILVGMLPLIGAATPVINDASYWGNGAGAGNSVVDWSPIDDSGVRSIDTFTSAGGTVTIAFTGDGLGPAVRVGDQDSNFTGDFFTGGPDLLVRFTLTAQTVAPASLNLYFMSAADGGSVWNSLVHLNLNSMTVGVPRTYSMYIGAASAWELYSGPGSSFSSAFASVSEFGFELVGANYGASQGYQISDVYFAIPEPDTIWMALAVLLSLLITFRSRIGEVMKPVLARIRN